MSDRKYPPSYYRYQNRFKQVNLHIPKETYQKFVKMFGTKPREYLTDLITKMVNDEVNPIEELAQQEINTLKQKNKSLQELNKKLMNEDEE